MNEVNANNSLLYGYMRLSKKSKNRKNKSNTEEALTINTDDELAEELARQKRLILNAGVPEANILNEGIVSGLRTNNRPLLNQILGWGNYEGQPSILPKGSTLVVCEYSRLSRDFDTLGQITSRLLQLDIKLIVLDFAGANNFINNQSGIDDITVKAMNAIARDMLIYIAAKERDYISERTKQALALKKEQGYTLGRPKTKTKIDPELLDKVFQLYEMEHKINSKEAIKMLGTKRATFFNIMKEERKIRFSSKN